jgi:ectoine hydroxylase-related dioxygenase (phytanoyl-CoA dioxygenase family)
MKTEVLLPELGVIRTIPREQVDYFRRNGHILLRNVLSSDELAAYEPVITEAAERYNTEKRRLEERDTYGRAFLQIMNLWRHDEAVKKFVLAKRFARIAADLMGVGNVRLYHDQALFKEAGGGPTPWHIDQYYWPLDTHNTITMWMPLVDITVKMGMLTFASGSHQAGADFQHEISDASDKELSDFIRERNFPVTRAITMNAGDATWHFGRTIHSAPGNDSAVTRKVMTIIYYADGARVTEPTNKWQADDRKTWLGNLGAGELANSELNPLLL